MPERFCHGLSSTDPKQQEHKVKEWQEGVGARVGVMFYIAVLSQPKDHVACTTFLQDLKISQKREKKSPHKTYPIYLLDHRISI